MKLEHSAMYCRLYRNASEMLCKNNIDSTNIILLYMYFETLQGEISCICKQFCGTPC